jgi:site-specific recombinase XerC
LLAEAPPGKRDILSDQVDEFIAYLRDERGLSPRTISHQRWHIEKFLRMQKVETAGIAYRSRRARQRYARSFDMLRCEGGVPPE